jgi:hypothetical protein
VAGLAAQPASEPGEHLPPPGPVEVVFDVYPQQTGVKVHGCPPHVSPEAIAVTTGPSAVTRPPGACTRPERHIFIVEEAYTSTMKMARWPT